MTIFNISPIDGRYHEDVKELIPYFSEYALIRYKIIVELEYLLALNRYVKPFKCFSIEEIKSLKSIYLNFCIDDAKEIKSIEQTTNHDTKAIEYFLQNKLTDLNLTRCLSFIHFALTGDDTNNLAHRLMWIQAVKKIYLPNLEHLLNNLKILVKKYSTIPLLSLTHGQSATPTTVGKEINVFASRLERQLKQLQKHKITGKLNGATGTFGAQEISYPEIDWLDFSSRFIEKLGLEANLITTQIEPGDSLVEEYQIIFRINSILTDLCQDFWFYISRNIFKLQKKDTEAGSSTMPHKVNPIHFENAEGNLGIARALFAHLSQTLPISRMQRDLSGSTVIRNQGTALAHSFLALKQINKGLTRLQINEQAIQKELNEHWEILAEPIQMILRKYGDSQAYDKLKELTRGTHIDSDIIKNIIINLNIPDEEKKKLLNLTPTTYTGLAEKLAKI